MAVTTTSSLRLLIASFAISAVLGVAACGGDDSETTNDNGSDAIAATSDSTTAASQPSTDEGQIKALIAQVQKAFKAGDGTTICDSLTQRGQTDIVRFGNATGLRGKECADIASAVAERERERGTDQRPYRVLSVRVRDRQAVALVRLVGAPTLRQRYIKEDGEWKVISFNLAVTVGA